MAQLNCVFDRVDPGGEAFVQSLPGKRVTRNLVTLIVSLVDECLNFLEREGRRVHYFAVRRKSEFISGVKLNPVCAVHELFPDAFTRFPPVIDRLQHRGDRKSTRLNSSHPIISYAL